MTTEHDENNSPIWSDMLDVQRELSCGLLKSNDEGHAGTQRSIDSLTTTVTAYGRLLALALLILGGALGVRIVLPDGTAISPAEARSEVLANAEAHALPD